MENIAPLASETTRQAPDRGKILIVSIVEAAANEDTDTLSRLLKLLPLDQLPVDRADDLLHMFLQAAYENRQEESVKVIMEAWTRTLPPNVEEESSIISTLFNNSKFGSKLLKFVTSVYPTYIFAELISDLANEDSSPYIYHAAQKGVQVFGEQTFKVYQELYLFSKGISSFEEDRIMVAKNEVLTGFFADKLRETSPFAEKPKWVKTFPSITDQLNLPTDPLTSSSTSSTPSQRLPYSSELLIPSLLNTDKPIVERTSIGQVVDLLTDGLIEQGFDIEDITQAKIALANRLAGASALEQAVITQDLFLTRDRERVQRNDNLSRILGPANPITGASAEEMKYGGCRMLTCDLYPPDSDSSEHQDWFTGNCDQCYIKIRYRWYAIRIPGVSGGWKGCFHSPECMKKYVGALSDTEYVSASLLNSYIGQVLTIGIQDRLPDSSPINLTQIEHHQDPDDFLYGVEDDALEVARRIVNIDDSTIIPTGMLEASLVDPATNIPTQPPIPLHPGLLNLPTIPPL